MALRHRSWLLLLDSEPQPQIQHADRSWHLLEAGDIEESLQAASIIGDDTLQQQVQGQVRPETFTHGSSAQRMGWFHQGLSSGDLSDCNTFATSQL